MVSDVFKQKIFLPNTIDLMCNGEQNQGLRKTVYSITRHFSLQF